MYLHLHLAVLECTIGPFIFRFVIDWSDHVWTEVYSEQQKRWMHCDSCENACDTPLMYEAGWGKKLNYVIAFSKDEIIDVSYRYSKQHENMTKLRTEIREHVLQMYINSWNKAKYAKLLASRRSELENRYCRELIEFLFPRLEIKSDESQGRSSGSLDWRQGRGELGSASSAVGFQSFTIVPTVGEINEGEILLTYYSFEDVYTRKYVDNQKMPGWKSCLYEYKNIFRKLEKDWKQVYLCRNENSSQNEEGRLVWMFKCTDINDSPLNFDSIEIELSTKTFNNGKIRGILCANDSCSLLKCKFVVVANSYIRCSKSVTTLQCLPVVLCTIYNCKKSLCRFEHSLLNIDRVNHCLYIGTHL